MIVNCGAANYFPSKLFSKLIVSGWKREIYMTVSTTEYSEFRVWIWPKSSVYHKCAFSWASQSVAVSQISTSSTLVDPMKKWEKINLEKYFKLCNQNCRCERIWLFLWQRLKASCISHPVASSPLLVVRPCEGSKALVVVVGRPWRVQTPVEAQIQWASRDILTKVGRSLIVIEPLVERFHTLVVMTQQARLQNPLLLLKRSRRSICREVKISQRLVRDWQEPRCRGGLTRPGRPDQVVKMYLWCKFPGPRLHFGLSGWDQDQLVKLPYKVVEQLVCRKRRESVVHHPGHQVSQLVSESNLS